MWGSYGEQHIPGRAQDPHPILCQGQAGGRGWRSDRSLRARVGEMTFSDFQMSVRLRGGRAEL